MSEMVVAVEVLPDFSKFGSAARRGIEQAFKGISGNPFRAMETDAAQSGKAIGDALARGATQGIQALTRLSRAADRTAVDVSAAAARSATGMAKGYATGANAAQGALSRVSKSAEDTASDVAAAHARSASSMATSYADAAASASAAMASGMAQGFQVPSNWATGMGASGSSAGDAAGQAFARTYTGHVQQATNQAEALLTKGIGTAAIVGGGFVATALTKGFQRLTTIEDAKMAMGVILNSQKAADDLMANTLQVVQGTPFALDQFADAAKTLVAFNVAAADVPKILTSIGEAAAASGRGAEGVGNLVQVFGQMAATGKVSLDEVWRISSGGVNALAILGNHFHLTTAAMQDMISNGSVPAAEGIKALTDGIANGSDGVAGHVNALGGTMQALAKTVHGSLDNFKTAIARMGAGLLAPFMGALPGVLNAASAGLDLVTTRLKELSATVVGGAGIQQAISGITSALEGLDQAQIDKVLGRISEILPFIAAGFAGLITQVAGMLPVIGPLVGGLSPITVAIVAFGMAIPKVRSALGDFIAGVAPVAVAIADRLTPILHDLVDLVGAVAPIAFGAAKVGIQAVGIVLIGVLDVVKPLTGWLTRHKEVVVGIATAYGLWAAQAKIIKSLELARGAQAIAAGAVMTPELSAARSAASGAGQAVDGGLIGAVALGATKAKEGADSLGLGLRNLASDYAALRDGTYPIDDIGDGFGRVKSAITAAKDATDGWGAKLKKLNADGVEASTAMIAGIAAFAAGAALASGIMDRLDKKNDKSVSKFEKGLKYGDPGNSEDYLSPAKALARAAAGQREANRLRTKAAESQDKEGAPSWLKRLGPLGGALGVGINPLDDLLSGRHSDVANADSIEKSAAADRTRAHNMQGNYKLVAAAAGLTTREVQKLAVAQGVDLTKSVASSTDARKNLVSSINEIKDAARAAGMNVSKAVTLDPKVVKENQKLVDQVGQQVKSAWSSFFDLTQLQDNPVDPKDVEAAAQSVADATDKVTEAQKKLNDAKLAEPESISDKHTLRDLKDAVALANVKAHGVFKTREEAQAASDALRKAQQDLSDFQETQGEKQSKDAADRAEKIRAATKELAQAKQDQAKAEGKQAELTAKDKPLNGKTIKDFYTEKLNTAQAFISNIQTALQQGYDPDLIGRMFAQGPEKAGKLLETLVGQTTTTLRDIVNESEKAASDYANFAQNLAEKNQIAMNAASTPGMDPKQAARMRHEVTGAANLDRIMEASGYKGSYANLSKMTGLSENQIVQIAHDFGLDNDGAMSGYAHSAEWIGRGRARQAPEGVVYTQLPGGPGSAYAEDPTRSVAGGFQAWLAGHPGERKALEGVKPGEAHDRVAGALFRNFLDDAPKTKKYLDDMGISTGDLVKQAGKFADQIRGLTDDAVVHFTTNLGEVGSEVAKFKAEVQAGVMGEATWIVKFKHNADLPPGVEQYVLASLGLQASTEHAPSKRSQSSRGPLQGSASAFIGGLSGSGSATIGGGLSGSGSADLSDWRWGGLKAYASGGIEQAHVQSGERIRYAEPQTIAEAYIPKAGDQGRSESITKVVAGWLGGVFLSAKDLAGKTAGRVKSFASGGVNDYTINNMDPVGTVQRGPDDPFWYPGTDGLHWENGVWYDGAGRKVGTGSSPLRGPINWIQQPGLYITDEMRRWNGRWPTYGLRGDAYRKDGTAQWKDGDVHFGSSTGAGPGTFGAMYAASIKPFMNDNLPGALHSGPTLDDGKPHSSWQYRPLKGGGGNWVDPDTGKVMGWSDGRNGRVYQNGMFHQGVRNSYTMAMNRAQVAADEAAVGGKGHESAGGIVKGGSLAAAAGGGFFAGQEGGRNAWTMAMHRLGVQADKDWVAAQHAAKPGHGVYDKGNEGYLAGGGAVSPTQADGWFAHSGAGPGKWTGNTPAASTAQTIAMGGGRGVFGDKALAGARPGSVMADVGGTHAMGGARGGSEIHDDSITMNGDIILNQVGNDVAPRAGAELLRHAKRTRDLGGRS